jgi:hypothetical protein
MQCSKLGSYQLYLAMAFMSFSKKGDISNCCTASNYDTVCSLMHLIRQSTGERYFLYGLSDMREGDVGFIVTSTQSKVWNKLKRGRESIRGGPT